MKLQHIYNIEADLVLQTGLHIGAGDAQMHIGGIDNSIIKHPVSHEPYIPGSSLKGKIRSLLEWRSGMVRENHCPKEYELAVDQQKAIVKQILQLFGVSGDSKDTEFQAEIGHTRASFWDCSLCSDYVGRLKEDNILLTEAKSENRINRITGTAESPRWTERVPAGARFKFRLSLKKFDTDTEAIKNTLLEGLRLLEWDSLGGSGSRGYGKVKFENLKIDGKPYDSEFEQIQPFQSSRNDL